MTAKSMMKRYNILPRPTFRQLKANYLELDEAAALPAKAYMPEEAHGGDVAVTFPSQSAVSGMKDFQGANEADLQQALHRPDTVCRIEAPPGGRGWVRLTYRLDEEHPSVTGQLAVQAQEGSDVTVYVVFESGAAGGSVNFLQHICAGRRANVKIVKAQFHGGGVRHIEHRCVCAASGASVRCVDAELGGREAVVYCKADLPDDGAVFSSQAMYVGTGSQVVDMAYWISMQGRETKADVALTGALCGNARKAFRGTIDFLKGSKKAVGEESDTCMLLSPSVHSLSVPLLLCGEDDVVGNHASSAGQIDQHVLFYLMSRGFSLPQAQAVVVESQIRPVVDAVGDEALQERILSIVKERLHDGVQEGEAG